jgi:nucleoside-diphosphate-sugar epimerase
MRILVTGGSGFLGSHVAERARAAGHDVVCLVRKTSDRRFLETLGVELREGAVDGPLDGLLGGLDAVIHCAGLIKARTLADFERVHKDGTVNLAHAALAQSPGLTRFVHVSTAGVMGVGREGRPHVETDDPNPVTPYSKSKLSGERALLELAGDVPLTILRPPAIYGPRDDEILAFFQMVRRTRAAFRLGGSMKTMSLVYATDCADACLRAVDADVPSGSTYFLEDGGTYSFEDMAEAIAAAYGIRLLGAPNIPKPIVQLAALGSELFGRATGKVMIFTREKLPELLMEHFAVDSAAARSDLGWKPAVAFPEGARLTAEWYRREGWD